MLDIISPEEFGTWIHTWEISHWHRMKMCFFHIQASVSVKPFTCLDSAEEYHVTYTWEAGNKISFTKPAARDQTSKYFRGFNHPSFAVNMSILWLVLKSGTLPVPWFSLSVGSLDGEIQNSNSTILDQISTTNLRNCSRFKFLLPKGGLGGNVHGLGGEQLCYLPQRTSDLCRAETCRWNNFITLF